MGFFSLLIAEMISITLSPHSACWIQQARSRLSSGVVKEHSGKRRKSHSGSEPDWTYRHQAECQRMNLNIITRHICTYRCAWGVKTVTHNATLTDNIISPPSSRREDCRICCGVIFLQTGDWLLLRLSVSDLRARQQNVCVYESVFSRGVCVCVCMVGYREATSDRLNKCSVSLSTLLSSPDM